MSTAPTVRLVPPAPPEQLPVLDEHQDSAVQAILAGHSVVVLGAPGSGKTTTAVAMVAEAVRAGMPADRVVMLSPRRRSAGQLRERVAGLLGVVTRGPAVRTPTSLAFAVLRTQAVLAGEPAPVLISGPEQDMLLRELLEGHLEGDGVPVELPDGVPSEVLAQRAFRDELRDLIMRAAERGVGPDELAELGERLARPAWVFGSRLYSEYLDVVALGSATPDVGERLDPGLLVERAAGALATWPEDDKSRPAWDLVVVDDAHEATQSVAELVGVLADQGARVALLGDPDVAVQTHRGAVPGAFLGGFGVVSAPPVVLGNGWRQGPELLAVTSRLGKLVRGIGTHHHQDVVPRGPAAARIEAAIVGSSAQQTAVVARALREAHLLDEVPWRDMAVIARSGAQVAALRSGLARLGVPVTVPGAEVPVRSEPAVRPFLLALRCVVEPVLDEAAAASLLTSPIGGLDALGLRRLRQALREVEISSGGYRASGALLIEAVTVPGVAESFPPHAHAAARALRAVVRVLDAGRSAALETGATAATVLWALWSASRLEAPWRTAALAGGVAGQRADGDLDAMLALFKAAERYAERMPRATPLGFLEHLDAQDLTEDTLAPRAAASGAVTLCTAASAAGRQWELVAVVGLQEGSWPDLRLRDSLLGAQALADAVAGRLARGTPDLREARLAVLDDELRALVLAVSRARSRLLVTAVEDEEDRPSAFLDLVVPAPDDGGDAVPGDEAEDPRRVEPQMPLDLRGLVAQLRHEVLAPDLEESPSAASLERADAAARALAALAEREVPGADPASWSGLARPSTTAVLYGPETTAQLSPSRVESLSRCSLRWALESAGGTASGTFASHLGTLVHEIAQRFPTGTLEQLEGELDRLWPRLGLPEGWLTDRERRRAESMVAKLADYAAAHPDVIGTEIDFELELSTDAGPVRLRGRIDRLERDSAGRVRIVDVKTGKTAPSIEEARSNPQLGIYQLAVERDALADLPLAASADGLGDVPEATDAGALSEVPTTPTAGGASLVYLGTASRGATERHQPPLAEAEEPRWVDELVGSARAQMAGSGMTAVVNELCKFCPVRRSCPVQDEGVQVTA